MLTDKSIEFSRYKLYVSNAIGLLLFYLFVGVVLSGILKAATPKFSNLILDSTFTVIADFLGQFLVLWITILKINLRLDPSINFIPAERVDHKLLVAVLLVAIGYYFAYHNSLGILTDRIPVGKLFTDYFKIIENELKRNPFPFMVSALFIAPVFEELFFRGILLRGLLGNYDAVVSIVLSALLFGIFHMNGPQFVNAFLLGFILGYVYYSTRSLMLCVAIHAMNNGLAFYYGSDKNNPNLIGFFVGIFLLTIGLLAFRKFQMKGNSQ
jgi:membrane protease YdiL (CAAX protease family)